jgi:hypothetical protein
MVVPTACSTAAQQYVVLVAGRVAQWCTWSLCTVRHVHVHVAVTLISMLRSDWLMRCARIDD